MLLSFEGHCQLCNLNLQHGITMTFQCMQLRITPNSSKFFTSFSLASYLLVTRCLSLLTIAMRNAMTKTTWVEKVLFDLKITVPHYRKLSQELKAGT